MIAAPLFLHFVATVALYREVVDALDLRWRAAVAYGIAFLLWWGAALVLGINIGIWMERVVK